MQKFRQTSILSKVSAKDADKSIRTQVQGIRQAMAVVVVMWVAVYWIARFIKEYGI